VALVEVPDSVPPQEVKGPGSTDDLKADDPLEA
jgi:hypothetical protein